MTGKEPYDLVVVGGGITGAGIARDAALRGLRVALFEKTDYGSGTSSKSSKLIHGGLRYLEHGEIGLVFESVSERLVQSRVAPHLVQPLPFLVPIYEGGKVGLGMMNIGLWIYDTLALFRSPRFHRTYRGDKAQGLQPELKQDGLEGALEYYDCFTDDARLVLENILDARENGADCRSYTRVVGAARDGDRLTAVKIRDELEGTEETVATRALVLATGPWTDEVLDPLGVKVKRPLLRPTKGVHLVFPREKLPLERAITLISPVDGRVMFAIPWRRRTIIGTTDTDFEGSADEVHADGEDVRYLCKSANQYFPGAEFTPQDVLATWAGLRPLIHEEAEEASDVSREHQTYVGDDGVLIIAGGKLTTYRLMAKDVVRAAIRWLQDYDSDVFEGRKLRRPRTKKRPLPGAVGLVTADQAGIGRIIEELAALHEIPQEIAEHLCRTYGMRAHQVAALIEKSPALGEPMQSDLPYVWAEVEFAVTLDLARTLDDVLSRRVPLLLVGRDQGLDVAEEAADHLASILGWSAERRVLELERYRKSVADSRRFRDS